MNVSDLHKDLFVLRLDKHGDPLPGLYKVIKRECNGADLRRVDGKPRNAGFFTATRMRPATEAEVAAITGMWPVPGLERRVP